MDEIIYNPGYRVMIAWVDKVKNFVVSVKNSMTDLKKEAL